VAGPPAKRLKVSPFLVPTPIWHVISDSETLFVIEFVPSVKVAVAVGVMLVLSLPEVGMLSPLQLCKYLVWVVLLQAAKLLK
jgi:hypothetical protein